MSISWPAVTKWVVRIGVAILGFFALWAELAQIAPKVFGIEAERQTVMKYLAFDFRWLRFIIPLAALWFLWAILGIYRRLDAHAHEVAGRDAEIDGRLTPIKEIAEQANTRILSLETSCERRLQVLESRNAAVLPERPLGQNELDDDNSGNAAPVRWSWNGHEAQGPFCPSHGDRLKFVRHLGSNFVDSYSDFEEEYLGSGGWFGCPSSQKEEFRVREHMKVKTLRWRVSERFRAKYGIPPVEEPMNEQEREVKRAAAENARRLFPIPIPGLGSTRGSPPSTP